MAVDLKNLTADQQETLDFLVHDAVSKQGSAINNSGPKAQIDFLLAQGETLESIAAELED